MPRPNVKPQKPELPRPFAEIGSRIRQFRLSKDLEQSDLMKAGFTKATISRTENGFQAPNVALLIRLRELGADLNWIIAGSE